MVTAWKDQVCNCLQYHTTPVTDPFIELQLLPFPSSCLLKQALSVERTLVIKFCEILRMALGVQLKLDHAHGIYTNSLWYISYHILEMLEMTSLNSQICLASGGQIVKNWCSCQKIAIFVHLLNCISSVCVRMHTNSQMCVVGLVWWSIYYFD